MRLIGKGYQREYKELEPDLLDRGEDFDIQKGTDELEAEDDNVRTP